VGARLDVGLKDVSGTTGMAHLCSACAGKSVFGDLWGAK